jgi:hypothetical protein
MSFEGEMPRRDGFHDLRVCHLPNGIVHGKQDNDNNCN